MKKPREERQLGRIQKLFPGVKRLIDADASMQIEVTDYDAKYSNVKDPRSCAMATACRRKFGLDGVLISLKAAYMVKGGTAVRFSVHKELREQIVRFDRSGKFLPGTYRLEKIPPSRTMEAIRGNKNPRPRTGTGTKMGKFHRLTNVRKFPTVANVGI